MDLDIPSVVRNWGVRWSDENRKILTRWLQTFSVTQLAGSFHRFLMMYRQPLFYDANVLTSGAMCFYASLLIYRMYPQNITVSDAQKVIFAFASLYMLVDHYLDQDSGSSVNGNSKQDTIHRLTNVLKDPFNYHRQSSDPDFLQMVVDQLQIILTISPSCHDGLKRLFLSEVKSSLIQKDPHRSREDYMNMAKEKGGLTIHAIQSMLQIPPDKDGFLLGSIIQLIDDLNDLWVDWDDNIHTIVTHDYSHHGNVDLLFEQVIQLIDELSPNYNLFKFGLILLLMGLVGTDKHLFTKELIEKYYCYCPVTVTFQFNESFYRRMMKEL